MNKINFFPQCEAQAHAPRSRVMCYQLSQPGAPNKIGTFNQHNRYRFHQGEGVFPPINTNSNNTYSYFFNLLVPDQEDSMVLCKMPWRLMLKYTRKCFRLQETLDISQSTGSPNLSVHGNPPKGLLDHRLLGSTAQAGFPGSGVT